MSEEIERDVREMVDALQSATHYGPYLLILPSHSRFLGFIRRWECGSELRITEYAWGLVTITRDGGPQKIVRIFNKSVRLD